MAVQLEKILCLLLLLGVHLVGRRGTLVVSPSLILLLLVPPDPAALALVAGWNSIPEIIASSNDAAVWSAPSTFAAPGPAKAVSYAGL